jgi:hypothetical protein
MGLAGTVYGASPAGENDGAASDSTERLCTVFVVHDNQSRFETCTSNIGAVL